MSNKKIENRNISNMYEDWFLEYASYVILERAVPKIEDGLKPVQRRILHSMKEMHDSRYHKVANIIGNTMQYHPHGDAAIGDALVNLGQKDLLIDTQGNWGDIRTGDRSAAPRYIEARLSEFSIEVAFNKPITKTQPSYDGRKNEPISLPMKFPLLLAQGAEGIAVGLSTKILPHNFNELLNACIQILIDKPFKIYPDFQTGGLIDVSQYNKGKRGGRVRVRSHIDIIDKHTLKISSIPYSTTTTNLIDSIVKANNSGKLKIKSIEDNTAEEIEIIVNLVKGVSPNITIDALYSFTNCEVSVSPNCCVINDNKPEFITVNQLLRISTENTLKFLKLELDYKLSVLKEKWHMLCLEKVFIENKIYRDIEECHTWDLIIDTIMLKLKPYINIFEKEIINEDVAKLTEIKIKKITKYDKLKQKNNIRNIEDEIAELNNDIKHITEYTIRYYEHLLNKYGIDKSRKTIISEFDSISVKSVAIANKKLFVNKKEGFIGTKLTKDDFVSKCSSVDDLVVFLDDGRYMVTKISDKKYIGKNINHIAIWKKNDKHMIYNLVYVDGKTKNSYVKRFSISSLIRDRFYNVTQGNEGSKVLYFTANPNSESETISIYLNSKAKIKNKTFEYDFKDLAIKNKLSKGNILTKYIVRRIIRKSIGESTLGGRKLWVDENIGKINLENRGIYLGSFNSQDKIIVFYKEGDYEVVECDLSKRFKMSEIFIVEKFNPNIVYSLMYKDGKSKQYYIKRFKIETLMIDKRFNLISESRGSRCKLVTNYKQLSINYSYKLKNNEKISKVLNVNNFIDIKGYKAIGNRLDNKSHMSGFKFKEILSIDNMVDNIKKDVKGELTLF
jgi:topoisomerase-4 subunit A